MPGGKTTHKIVKKRSAAKPKVQPKKSAKSASARSKSSVKKSTSKSRTAASKAKTQKKPLVKAKKQTSLKSKTAASKKKSTVKKSTAKKTIAKKTIAKKTSLKKIISKRKSTAKKNSAAKKSAKKTVAKKTKTKVSVKKSSIKKTVKAAKKKSTARTSTSRSKKKIPDFPTTTWGSNSVIHFDITDRLPPAPLTSIAGGIVFHDNKALLANVPGRGWEIIGGRIDIGEKPEETFRREAHKQLGATLSHVKLLGLLRIEHKGARPPNCPYPYPTAYGVQYIGIMDEMLPFIGSEDSLGRSLITVDGLPEHYFGWNSYFEAVFRYAFSEYKRWRKILKI